MKWRSGSDRAKSQRIGDTTTSACSTTQSAGRRGLTPTQPIQIPFRSCRRFREPAKRPQLTPIQLLLLSISICLSCNPVWHRAILTATVRWIRLRTNRILVLKASRRRRCRLAFFAPFAIPSRALRLRTPELLTQSTQRRSAKVAEKSGAQSETAPLPSHSLKRLRGLPR